MPTQLDTKTGQRKDGISKHGGVNLAPNTLLEWRVWPLVQKGRPHVDLAQHQISPAQRPWRLQMSSELKGLTSTGRNGVFQALLSAKYMVRFIKETILDVPLLHQTRIVDLFFHVSQVSPKIDGFFGPEVFPRGCRIKLIHYPKVTKMSIPLKIFNSMEHVEMKRPWLLTIFGHLCWVVLAKHQPELHRKQKQVIEQIDKNFVGQVSTCCFSSMATCSLGPQREQVSKNTWKEFKHMRNHSAMEAFISSQRFWMASEFHLPSAASTIVAWAKIYQVSPSDLGKGVTGVKKNPNNNKVKAKQHKTYQNKNIW